MVGKRKPQMSDSVACGVVWCNMHNFKEVSLVQGSSLSYLDGLAETPDGPILHRRNEVG